MKPQAIEPTRGTAQIGNCDPHETLSHPAFAVVRLAEVSGGPSHLFGSDLRHDRSLRVSVHRATLERNLSSARFSAENAPIIEFNLSQAQLAQFILSPNRGEGTPVTLSSFKGDSIPEIKPVETKAELLEREIAESAKRQVAELQGLIEKFGDMLSTGKVGIKEARELHRSMTITTANLPSNMQYVVNRSRDAVNTARDAAKLELDAMADSVARQVGLKSFEQLVAIDAQSHMKQIG